MRFFCRLAHLALAASALAACTRAPPPRPSSLAAFAIPALPADARAACREVARDDDADGLDDACEDRLADRFAPIVIHSSDESNWPTDVDDFLASTALAVRDETCAAADKTFLVARAPSQADLLHRSFPSPCGSTIASDGSRSAGKHRTFFLTDVDDARRAGSTDTTRWTTYVHVYANDAGGVTLQYWRFYAYNDAFNDHGGDWEAVHVALDRALQPIEVDLLGHSSIGRLAPSEVAWERDHVVVYAEGGGHATRASGDAIGARNCELIDPCVVSLDDRASYVRQETWRGGSVSWPSGVTSPAGRLVNVGEKSAPRNGQLFVQYSGLWGSPGTFYGTSGYWGPAYNETEMATNGFTTAWCERLAGRLDRAKECWANDREP